MLKDELREFHRRKLCPPKVRGKPCLRLYFSPCEDDLGFVPPFVNVAYYAGHKRQHSIYWDWLADVATDWSMHRYEVRQDMTRLKYKERERVIKPFRQVLYGIGKVQL